jgi:hypothetical protein
MAQRITSTLLFAAIVATIWVQYSTPARASAADQCIPAVDVTGSLADEGKTAYKSLYDGDTSTYLRSSAKGWQYVQFDFGCEVDLYELRRYMTQDGKRTDGARTSLGEGILHSRDGVSWFGVTNETSSGWQDANILKSDDAVGYRGFAWHSLPYGWSPSLLMAKPIRARYVRYNWDILSDSFHELQLSYRRVDTVTHLGWDWSAWDWTANSLVEVHYDDDNRGHPGQPIELPWNDFDGECYQENPDIASSDGWVLLTGNFGTSLITPRPDYPYFVLYNKYRGIMRPYIFYGSRASIPHQATHQMGTLAVENGDVATFTHYTGKYLHDFNPRYEQMFIKKHLLLNHWACLEFDVSGYDPAIGDVSKTGASFRMRFHGLEEAVLQADLIGGLSGTLEASNVRVGQDGSGVFDATVGGFLKAVSIYQDIDDTLDKMTAKGDANPMTWWGPLLSTAASLASQNTVPLIGAAAGFITSLIDGGGSGNVPLSYRTELAGEFHLNGTIQTAPALSLLRFYVPGTIYGNTPELEPLYQQPLGVYSLAYEPSIEYYTAPNGPIALQMGGTYGVGVYFDASSVIVNPQSGLQLHSVRVSLVSPSYAPGPFTDPSTYVGLPSVWMNTTRFNSLKVGVRLQFERIGQPTAPLITMYREYVPTRENQGVCCGY